MFAACRSGSPSSAAPGPSRCCSGSRTRSSRPHASASLHSSRARRRFESTKGHEETRKGKALAVLCVSSCPFVDSTPLPFSPVRLQEPGLSVIDEVLIANEKYYQTFMGGMQAVQPARKLMVLTCMDSRIDTFEILGLKSGDAHVIRNAGGIVTDDALRSVLISHHLLGTEELMIINHTDCGLMLIQDDEI